MQAQGIVTAAPAERRYYVDWLRILATLAVFLFHTARFFDLDGWHAKNLQLEPVASFFTGLTGQWIMPLFFLLSGASTCWALGLRRPSAFVGERSARLLVPLVFGIFALALPQVYVEVLSTGRFAGGFVEFLPHYFDGLYGFGGNFAWMGLHLWYLLILFLFSVLLLPLFLALRGERGRRLTAVATSPLQAPGVVLLLFLPLALLEIVLDPHGLGRRDFGGWNLFAYALLFVYGYTVLGSGPGERAIRRHGTAAMTLAVGTVLTAIVLGWVDMPVAPGSLEHALLMTLRAANSWFWLVGIVGLGARFLDRKHSSLGYLNRAVMPFYMLHQTVIVLIGFQIAAWAIDPLPKYLLLGGVSFVAIALIYELLVRRLDLLHPVFGIKGGSGKKAGPVPLPQQSALSVT